MVEEARGKNETILGGRSVAYFCRRLPGPVVGRELVGRWVLLLLSLLLFRWCCKLCALRNAFFRGPCLAFGLWKRRATNANARVALVASFDLIRIRYTVCVRVCICHFEMGNVVFARLHSLFSVTIFESSFYSTCTRRVLTVCKNATSSKVHTCSLLEMEFAHFCGWGFCGEVLGSVSFLLQQWTSFTLGGNKNTELKYGSLLVCSVRIRTITTQAIYRVWPGRDGTFQPPVTGKGEMWKLWKFSNMVVFLCCCWCVISRQTGGTFTNRNGMSYLASLHARNEMKIGHTNIFERAEACRTVVEHANDS